MDPSDTYGDGDHADAAARLHTSLTGPSLDPATRQRHLDAIRARAATMPTPTPAPVPARARTGDGLVRRLASTVTAAGLVAVLGASGAVAAAHDALPGHTLYPVKHVTEQLVLAAPMSTERAVAHHLAFAGRRLDEAAALADRDADATLVAGAIAAHTQLMTRAGTLAHDHPDLADQVDTATRRARQQLAQLLDQDLPAVAADRARAALSAADARLDRHPLPASPPPPPASTPEEQPRAPQPPAGPPASAPAPDHAPAPREGDPGSAPRTPSPGDPDAPEQRQEGQQRQPSQPAPATSHPHSPVPGPERSSSRADDRGGPGHGPEPPADDEAPADGRVPAGDRPPPGGAR